MKKIDFSQMVTVLANVGVIAGIAFLAYEMRQNTQVARQEAYSSFTQSITDVNTTIASNPQLAALIARTTEGASAQDFTSAERIQLDINNIALLRVYEGLYQSLEEGIVDEGYFETMRDSRGPWTSNYFRETWSSNRGVFDPRFVQFFESEIMR